VDGGIGFDALSRIFSWSSLVILTEAKEDESNKAVLLPMDMLLSCNDVVGFSGFWGALCARVLRGVKALYSLGF
jgi:hypothetical protein